MNYTELILDTLDYEILTDENNNVLLKYRVRAVGTSVEATCDLNLTHIDNLLDNWDNREDLTWESVMEVGHVLGGSLFGESLREILVRRLPNSDSDEGLRVRLNIQYPLTNYPFEYILINDTGGETTANHFLGLRRNISIVRHQGNQAPPTHQPKAIPPTKIVVALASPKSFPPVLDLSREKIAIENAIKKYPHLAEITICEPASQSSLQEMLKDAPIFHYAGHAAMNVTASRKIFGVLEGKGKLILDDGYGIPDPLTVEQLSVMLKNAKTRLAVLGGCETARRDDLNVWSSTAAHLLNAGLFAVVGMQYKIGNSSAIIFSREFYNALLAGMSIDQAVTNGRMEIAAQGNVRDWAVPVLYLTDISDGIVFNEFKDNPALDNLRKEIDIKVNQTAKDVEGTMIGIKAKNPSWGRYQVTHKIDRVKKDAVVIGVELNKGGGEVSVDQELGNVEGDVTGVVIDDL
jgi:hypothetical protein